MTVLNFYTVTEYNWSLFWIVFLAISFVLFAGINIWCHFYDGGMTKKECIHSLFFSLIFGCIIIIFPVLQNNEKYVVQEVIINENINLKEFTDQYEILDIQGDIYCIRERKE